MKFSAIIRGNRFIHIRITRLVYEFASLKHWNTPDIDQVNDDINRMADYHLTQTAEEKDPDEDYFEFNNTYNQLYPYEIMAWLTLRAHRSLPNPTQFNHAWLNSFKTPRWKSRT
jgi:hypothetical protein